MIDLKLQRARESLMLLADIAEAAHPNEAADARQCAEELREVEADIPEAVLDPELSIHLN